MPNRREDPERTCLVTRATAPAEALIRFVVAPDGTVVPDFRRRLPGRGMWVTARADCVATAEKRRLFARAHGGPVKVEPGLADRVERGFAAGALAALSMARKAGGVVTGFAKVEAALAKGDVIALIHAAEAAPDGVSKLDAAGRRRGVEGKLAVIRCFTGEQLDLAFGRPNVIHAALLAGSASRNLMARVEAWLAYRGDERPEGDLAAPTAQTRTAERELPKREKTERELTEFMSSGQREE